MHWVWIGCLERIMGTERHCGLCRAFLPLSRLTMHRSLCEHHKILSILYCTHIYQSRMLEKLFKRLGEQAGKQPCRKYQLNLTSLWFGRTCPRHMRFSVQIVCHLRKNRHHTFLRLFRSRRLSIEPIHRWALMAVFQLEEGAVGKRSCFLLCELCSGNKSVAVWKPAHTVVHAPADWRQRLGAHLHAPESRENLVSACTTCQLPKRIPTSGHAGFNNGASLGICCEPRDYTRIEIFF